MRGLSRNSGRCTEKQRWNWSNVGCQRYQPDACVINIHDSLVTQSRRYPPMCLLWLHYQLWGRVARRRSHAQPVRASACVVCAVRTAQLGNRTPRAEAGTRRKPTRRFSRLVTRQFAASILLLRGKAIRERTSSVATRVPSWNVPDKRVKSRKFDGLLPPSFHLLPLLVFGLGLFTKLQERCRVIRLWGYEKFWWLFRI